MFAHFNKSPLILICGFSHHKGKTILYYLGHTHTHIPSVTFDRLEKFFELLSKVVYQLWELDADKNETDAYLLWTLSITTLSSIVLC